MTVVEFMGDSFDDAPIFVNQTYPVIFKMIERPVELDEADKAVRGDVLRRQVPGLDFEPEL